MSKADIYFHSLLLFFKFPVWSPEDALQNRFFGFVLLCFLSEIFTTLQKLGSGIDYYLLTCSNVLSLYKALEKTYYKWCFQASKVVLSVFTTPLNILYYMNIFQDFLGKVLHCQYILGLANHLSRFSPFPMVGSR